MFSQCFSEANQYRTQYATFSMQPCVANPVCNLHEPIHIDDDPLCWDIEVRSCRLNGMVEGSVEVPIFSPLDELVKAREGAFYDNQWLDIGFVECPQRKYI